MSTVATETIGQRLRRLRREAGLSQRDLSGPGVSYAYISRIEGGTRQPSMKAIRQLAARLGVDPEYLETGEGPIVGVTVRMSYEAAAAALLALAPASGHDYDEAYVGLADALRARIPR